MPTRELSDDEYRRAFTATEASPAGPIHAKALERALDIRKFEIDLYWRRSAYFWTFIAATLAGLAAVQASQSVEMKQPLSVLLCNLGIAFSAAWLCANRGSKQWQENWENHVDLLEDAIQGPLYKVVLARSKPVGVQENLIHILTGPSPFSVSKVNQLTSAYILLVWIGLLVYVLPPIRTSSPIHWPYLIVTSLTALLCLSFMTLGRTYAGGYWHRGTIRTSKINNVS